jgi:hypothetical protein
MVFPPGSAFPAEVLPERNPGGLIQEGELFAADAEKPAYR